jgi:hypothetical protein
VESQQQNPRAFSSISCVLGSLVFSTRDPEKRVNFRNFLGPLQTKIGNGVNQLQSTSALEALSRV